VGIVAGYPAWLDPSDLARLEAGRSKLLKLKIDILKYLVRALRARDGTRIWSGSLELLTAALTSSEMHFLLYLDLRLRQHRMIVSGRSIDVQVPGMVGNVAIGGIVELLFLIGHYELRVMTATVNQRQLMLPPQVPAQEIFPYFKVIGHPR